MFNFVRQSTTAALLLAVTLIAQPTLSQTVYSPTPQPTDIPGAWYLGSLSLPNESAIIAAAEHNPDVAGLYAWASSYSVWGDEAYDVGWTGVRGSGYYQDNYVTRFVNNQINVMATLSLYVGTSKKDRTDFNTDQEYIDAYKNYIADFLNQYGPGGSFFTENPHLEYRPITSIELLNEPNFQYMLPNDDNLPRLTIEAMREALYAKILLQVYPFVKASWPEVQVVGFAAGGSASADTRFIQHVLEQDPNVINCFDVVSTHPYTRPEPSETYCLESWGNYSIINNLATIRGYLASHGRPDVPIYYTEVGWEISHAEGGTYADEPNVEYLTQELQAAYVTRIYALAMRLGVERVNIMYINDSDNFNGGFFKPAGRESPWRLSAHAAHNFIKLMPNPKYTGAIVDGVNGEWILKFSPDTNDQGQSLPDTVMAWRVHGTEVVQIPCNSELVKVVDVIGNEQIVATDNGTVEVEIGPLPMYIQPFEFTEPTMISRNIFYNDSAFDNNNPTGNADDDNAIATDKSVLFPGETATFSNYSSYLKGINGVMIDIAELPGTPTTADFEFKVGNDNTPGTWQALGVTPTITVRPGEGAANSDRITLTFPEYTAMRQWIEITVKATTNTGLTSDDVFYFGNTPGDTGDSTTDTLVNATDEINCRNNVRNFLNPATIDDPHDHNRDGKVDATDEIISRNFTTNYTNALNLISP